MLYNRFITSASAGLFTLSIIATGASAAPESVSTDAQKLVSLPIGQGKGQITYTPDLADREKRGAQSFAVATNGDIYILDTVGSQVEVFDKRGASLTTIQLPNEIEFVDLELAGMNTLYVLSDLGHVLEFRSGKQKKAYKFDGGENGTELLGLFTDNRNKTVLRYIDGREVEIGQAKKARKSPSVGIKRIGNTIAMNTGDQSIEVTYTHQAAGTYLLHVASTGEQFVLENEALIGEELYVETRVEAFKNGKNVGSALAIPTNDTYYTSVPEQFVYVAKNGNVYQMITTQESVDIYALPLTKDKKTNITQELIEKVKPQALSKDIAPATTTSLSTNAYTPAEAYNRALSITDLSWTYNPATHKTPTTSTLAPPEHLAATTTGSSQLGIPYNWGGFDGIDTSSFNTTSWTGFVDGLSKGNTAGNVDTDAGYVSGTVGLDCSGFISSIYKFSYKHSTSMFGGTSSPFTATTWSTIKQGDIGNKSGVHVWMWIGYKLNSFNEVIGYITREATTNGTEDKAKYWSRTLTDAQTYVPMKLK